MVVNDGWFDSFTTHDSDSGCPEKVDVLKGKVIWVWDQVTLVSFLGGLVVSLSFFSNSVGWRQSTSLTVIR